MTAIPLVLAQDAQPPAVPGGPVIAGAVSVSVVFVIAALCWVGVSKWGWKWSAVVAGACLGVAGAGGFVGEVCRMLIGIGLKMLSALIDAFH